ncbi:MAG: hypothetical protein ACE361_09680 [Aureliella sp.]
MFLINVASCYNDYIQIELTHETPVRMDLTAKTDKFAKQSSFLNLPCKKRYHKVDSLDGILRKFR